MGLLIYVILYQWGTEGFPDARPIKKSLNLSSFIYITGLISSDVVGLVFGTPEACKQPPSVTISHTGMMTPLQTADAKLIVLRNDDIVSWGFKSVALCSYFTGWALSDVSKGRVPLYSGAKQSKNNSCSSGPPIWDLWSIAAGAWSCLFVSIFQHKWNLIGSYELTTCTKSFVET